MAELGAGGTELCARIVYWGVAGAGKSSNLRVIHAKLRPDHRGELRRFPTRIDPSVCYELLPIELGQVGGRTVRLQVVSVPGASEHALTRKQLLDQADGVVFVVDTARDRIDENLASFEELRSALAAYGRPLEDVPLVLQYNKRDHSDPFALEELHRKLQMRGVAAFEAVASEGTGVLQTLTTISKRVVRRLREEPESGIGEEATRAETAEAPAEARAAPAAEAPPTRVDAPAAEPFAPAEPEAEPEPAIAAEPAEPEAEVARATADEARALFEPAYRESFEQATRELSAEEAAAAASAAGAAPSSAPAPSLTIASVGEPEGVGSRSVRLPVVLRDESGRETAVALTVRVDPAELPDPD